ncbi:TPA: DUF371 domain-containing protein, partial [Candidatus Woesearchaeota archaeon]|nr:DUF371 domain-containing protein [Candidatus Woesearchaeota archaeon]
MKYIFTAHGHPNILATHRTTLEITKDSELTTRGNCVVAVAADFSLIRSREKSAATATTQFPLVVSSESLVIS